MFRPSCFDSSGFFRFFGAWNRERCENVGFGALVSFFAPRKASTRILGSRFWGLGGYEPSLRRQTSSALSRPASLTSSGPGTEPATRVLRLWELPTGVLHGRLPAQPMLKSYGKHFSEGQACSLRLRSLLHHRLLHIEISNQPQPQQASFASSPLAPVPESRRVLKSKSLPSLRLRSLLHRRVLSP